MAKAHVDNTADDSNDSADASYAAIMPQPNEISADEGAIDRYKHLLESSAVATLFSVMASNKASPGDRLQAAHNALMAIGKASPPQIQQQLPGITIQLMEPVRNAFRGIADVVDVIDRTPRIGASKDGV
jgi:hypothetical protein